MTLLPQMVLKQGPCIRVSLGRKSAIKLTSGKELRVAERKHDSRSTERKLDQKKKKLLKGSKNQGC